MIICFISWFLWGFPGASASKEPTCQCRRHKRCRFDSWVRRIPWSRTWRPAPVFLSGKTSWSLTGYRLWCHKESDTTEAVELTHRCRAGFQDGLRHSWLWSLSWGWVTTISGLDLAWKSLSQAGFQTRLAGFCWLLAKDMFVLPDIDFSAGCPDYNQVWSLTSFIVICPEGQDKSCNALCNLGLGVKYCHFWWIPLITYNQWIQCEKATWWLIIAETGATKETRYQRHSFHFVLFLKCSTNIQKKVRKFENVIQVLYYKPFPP